MNAAPIKATVTIIIICLLHTAHASREIPKKTRREVIEARHGAVASDDGRCSEIGRDVLTQGGHAVDAAVAAALCLGVVSPASSGIGGGAFMIIRSKSGQTHAFDMRETAPKLASENMFSGNAALKSSGALSVGVPGELAGLYEAWKKYGKLPWKRLVNPSVKLARNGFKISPYLYMQMTRTESGIKADKGLSQIFTSKGKLLQPGDICFNKMLAKTLSDISKNGLSSFYNGSIAMNMVRDVRKGGGILSLKDLQSYRVRIRKPIVTDVMGLKILGMPPPSSGGVAMSLILNILDQYKLPKGDAGPLGIHREIEALKHAFAMRMNLGDPDFVNITNVVSDMLSPKFAADLKKTIFDNMTFSPSHYGGRWNIINDHGTSHVSIVDKERNAVSMTNTINSYFGALFLSPSTGIVLNNEMDDFSVPSKNRSLNVPPPAPSNFIRPDKRPLSSMSPTIVLQGERLRAVVGASGGAFIIAGTTEVFLNYFVKGMDPLSSVLAPRYYHQLIPNVVQYENWTTVIGDHFELPLKTRRVLQKKGHALQALAGGTICQLIVDEKYLDPSKSPKLVADNNIEFWRMFVSEFFVHAKKKWCVSLYGNGRQITGVFPQDVWQCEICNRKPGRGFEATAEVLPRLFKIKYESGTLEELLYVDMPREYQNNSGQIVLDYAKAIQETVFEQLRVVRDGQLRLVFSPELKICSWEFCARRHGELIPRRLLIPQVSQLGATAQKYQAATQTASSSMSVPELQNHCSMFVASARQLAKALEIPLVNDLGYTKRYVRCLQISEVGNSMKDLIDYSGETGTGPMGTDRLLSSSRSVETGR